MVFKRRWLAGVVAVAGVAGAIAAGSALASSPSTDQAAPTPTPAPAIVGRVNVYSAPFTCGLVPNGNVPLDPSQPQQGMPNELPLKPANYATDVNVHNPNMTEVPLRKKAVLTGWISNLPGATVQTSEPEQVFRGGKFKALTLPPDGAFQVDCNDITKVLQPPEVEDGASFIKGYVVIESRSALDVDTVITSERVGPIVINCLLSDGSIVPAAVTAAGTTGCPSSSAGTAGTISIAASSTGTGLATEVQRIPADVVTIQPGAAGGG